MGNDPRGVHQSLVSNVLWNTHSPKLTKVRGFRGSSSIHRTGVSRRGYCNNRCDSDSFVFNCVNTSVTALVVHMHLEPRATLLSVFFNFTMWDNYSCSYWKLRVYFIWHCRGDQPRQRFVMPLAMQHWVSQLLSLAAPNSQQPVCSHFIIESEPII